MLQYSILTVVTGDSCRGRLTKVSHQNGFIVSFWRADSPWKTTSSVFLGSSAATSALNPAQQKGLEHSMKLIGCRQEQQCYKLPHTRSPESKYENLWSLSSDSLKQIWQVSQGEREHLFYTRLALLNWHLFCDLPYLGVIWGVKFGTKTCPIFSVSLRSVDRCFCNSESQHSNFHHKY